MSMKTSGKAHRDGLEITALGALYTGPLEKKFWSSSRGKEKYPYPIGYQATRWHGGHTYFMEVSEGPRGPLFAVMCEEGIACSGQTPSVPWEDILKKRHSGAKKVPPRSSSSSIDGPEMFGFTNPLVQRLCQDLVAFANGLAEGSDAKVDSRFNMETDASGAGRQMIRILAESNEKAFLRARGGSKLMVNKDIEHSSGSPDKNVKQLQSEKLPILTRKHAKRTLHVEEHSWCPKVKRVIKGREMNLEDSGDTAIRSKGSAAHLLIGVPEDEQLPRHHAWSKRPRLVRLKEGILTEKDHLELEKASETTRSAAELHSTTNLVYIRRKKRLKSQVNQTERAANSPSCITSKQSSPAGVIHAEDRSSLQQENMHFVVPDVIVEDSLMPRPENCISVCPKIEDSETVDEALSNCNKKKKLKLARPDQKPKFAKSGKCASNVDLAQSEAVFPSGIMCPSDDKIRNCDAKLDEHSCGESPHFTKVLATLDQRDQVGSFAQAVSRSLHLCNKELEVPPVFLHLRDKEFEVPPVFLHLHDKEFEVPPPFQTTEDPRHRCCQQGDVVDLGGKTRGLEPPNNGASMEEIAGVGVPFSEVDSGISHQSGSIWLSPKVEDGQPYLCLDPLERFNDAGSGWSGLRIGVATQIGSNSSDHQHLSTLRSTMPRSVESRTLESSQVAAGSVARDELIGSLFLTKENSSSHCANLSTVKPADADPSAVDSCAVDSPSHLVHASSRNKKENSIPDLVVAHCNRSAEDTKSTLHVTVETDSCMYVTAASPKENSPGETSLGAMPPCTVKAVVVTDCGRLVDKQDSEHIAVGEVPFLPTALPAGSQVISGVYHGIKVTSDKVENTAVAGFPSLPVLLPVGLEVLSEQDLGLKVVDETVSKRTCIAEFSSLQLPHAPAEFKTEVDPVVTVEAKIMPTSIAQVSSPEVQLPAGVHVIHDKDSSCKCSAANASNSGKAEVSLQSAPPASTRVTSEIEPGMAMAEIVARGTGSVKSPSLPALLAMTDKLPGLTSVGLPASFPVVLPLGFGRLHEVETRMKVMTETLAGKNGVAPSPDCLPTVLPLSVERLLETGVKVMTESLPGKKAVVGSSPLLVDRCSGVNLRNGVNPDMVVMAGVPSVFCGESLSEVDPGLGVNAETVLEKTDVVEVPHPQIVCSSTVKPINCLDPVTAGMLLEQIPVVESASLPVVLSPNSEVLSEVDLSFKVTVQPEFQKTGLTDVSPLPVFQPSCTESRRNIYPDLDEAAEDAVRSEGAPLSIVFPSAQLTRKGRPALKLRAVSVAENKFSDVPILLETVPVGANSPHSKVKYGKVMENGVVTILPNNYQVDLLTDTLPDVFNGSSQVGELLIDEWGTVKKCWDSDAGISSLPIMAFTSMASSANDSENAKKTVVSPLMAGKETVVPRREVRYGKMIKHGVVTVLSPGHQVHLDTATEEEAMTQAFSLACDFNEQCVMGDISSSRKEQRLMDSQQQGCQKSSRFKQPMEIDCLGGYRNMTEASLESSSPFADVSNNQKELDEFDDAAVSYHGDKESLLETACDLPSQVEPSQSQSQKDESDSMSREVTKSMISLLLPQVMPLSRQGLSDKKTYGSSKGNNVELGERCLLEGTTSRDGSCNENKVPNKVHSLSAPSGSKLEIDKDKDVKVLPSMAAASLFKDNQCDAEVLFPSNAQPSISSVGQCASSVVGLNLKNSNCFTTLEEIQGTCLPENAEEVHVLGEYSLSAEDSQTQNGTVNNQIREIEIAAKDWSTAVTHKHRSRKSGHPQVRNTCLIQIADSVQNSLSGDTLETTVDEDSNGLQTTILLERLLSSELSLTTRDPFKNGETRAEEQITIPSKSEATCISSSPALTQRLSLHADIDESPNLFHESTSFKGAAISEQQESVVPCKVNVDILKGGGLQVDCKSEKVLLVRQDVPGRGVLVGDIVDCQENLPGTDVDQSDKLLSFWDTELNKSNDNFCSRVEESASMPAVPSRLQEVKYAGCMDSGCQMLTDALDYEGIPSNREQLVGSNGMESALCIDHPFPVLAMILNVRNDEVRLCVVCGVAEGTERTFLVYKVHYRENVESMPQILSTMTFICQSFGFEALNMKVPLEESAARFSPNGQQLLLLDCFKFPDSCYSTTGKHDGHGVNVVSLEKEVFAVSEHLPSDDFMQSLAVPGPQLLIAAGCNGCLNCWEMDSSWRTCKERFSLPRATCNGVPFTSVTKLSIIPGLPHIVVGCDYGGSFAVWDIGSRALLSTCQLPGHNVISASLLDIRVIDVKQDGALEKCDGEVRSLGDLSLDSVVCLLALVSCAGGFRLENNKDEETCEDLKQEDIHLSCKIIILKNGSVICGPPLPHRASAVTTMRLHGVMGTTGGLVHIWEVSSGKKLCELNELEGSSIVTLATNPSSSVLATANEDGQVILYMKRDKAAMSISR